MTRKRGRPGTRKGEKYPVGEYHPDTFREIKRRKGKKSIADYTKEAMDKFWGRIP